MYEVDSDKFTSKPNPKKEFINYFKESGAAAALQKAMVLLYRMPVKPTNLAEFFSQYFENGAQQLMRISLLKAELCYKRDELQNRKLKVQEAENHIRQMIDKLGITDEEFEQKFVPSSIKEKNRLSILEHYFKDMESGILRRTVEDSTVHNKTSYLEPKVETNEPRDSNYDFENDCLRNVRSDHALKEDIKELDPWGIICKGSKSAEDTKKSFPKDKEHEIDGSENHMDEDHEPDDDDATSLAELFQQSSRDWVMQEHDENAAKLHNRLLMVRQADKIKMSDFMGWSPLQSRENLATSGTARKDHATNESSTRDSKEIESLKRRPCSQKGADIITSKGISYTNAGLQEPDNDAFLLEEDHLEHVYKLMETTQESFDYEFQRHVRKPREIETEEICEPICDLADITRICTASSDSVHPKTIYGEGEYEDDSLNESLGFIPGTMSNWTNHYMDYPSCSTAGEYYEFAGENEHCMADDFTLVSGKNSRTPLEVPMARIDSSCHCLFTGIYNTNEMLSENEVNEEGTNNEPVEADNSNRKSTTRGGRLSLQKDEATITDDNALDEELQEVFKQKQRRRSSIKKDKEKREEDETEEPTHMIDAFGIDLATEVKRTILGMKAPEISYAGGTEEQRSTGTYKQGKPHYRHVIQTQGMIVPYKK